jgi:hypothetical protein
MNPEKNYPTHIPKIAVKAMLGLAAATGSAVAVSPNIAAASQPAAHEVANSDPELATSPDIPKVAQTYIDNNAALIKNLGCSGGIIRNPSNNEPIGVVTAAHCDLRFGPEGAEFASNWIPGGNNKEYIIKENGIQVQTGNSFDGKVVGNVSEFALPKKGNVSIDEVVGAFKGHSLSEVMNVYDKEKLTEEEIATKLKPGEKIYMGSWPAEQAGTKVGNILQHFSMTYIGTKVMSTESGEIEKVLLAVMDEDSNAAACTPGASGSEAFYVDNTKLENGKTKQAIRPVGVLSTLVPLQAGVDYYSAEQAATDLAQYEQEYPDYKGWGTAAAVCGIAYKTLDKSTGYTPVKIVNSIEEVKSPVVKDSVTAQNLFLTPGFKSDVINGVVVAKTSTESASEEYSEVAIKNPIAFFNTDGSVALCYEGGTEGMSLDCILINNLDDLTFYKNNEKTPLSILKTTGISEVKAINKGANGSLTSLSGMTFGELAQPGQPLKVVNQKFKVEVKDGKPEFSPAK